MRTTIVVQTDQEETKLNQITDAAVTKYFAGKFDERYNDDAQEPDTILCGDCGRDIQEGMECGCPEGLEAMTRINESKREELRRIIVRMESRIEEDALEDVREGR